MTALGKKRPNETAGRGNSMNRSENLYMAESGKSVGQFVADFGDIVKKNDFVVNNFTTMGMKKTFREHGADAALVIAVSYIIQVQSAAWWVKLTPNLFGPLEEEVAVRR